MSLRSIATTHVHVVVESTKQEVLAEVEVLHRALSGEVQTVI
ncbi:hypothetical protein ABH912_001125 [Pseudomonas sp. BT76 TE3572]|uniref:Uncharacterized protein n=1 Tax=Pseudomonas mandelii PD30 TaxID=1419583 RepID=A0A059L8R6_9PSED|nr:hypothetical protein [Pseudomonas mandelii]KDD70732.1 hypothetical protein V466_04065 [Pseudomonas mandelii PD30]